MKDHMNAPMSKDLKDWYASASNGREEMADAKAQAQFGSTKTVVTPSSDTQGAYYDGPFGGRKPGGN